MFEYFIKKSDYGALLKFASMDFFKVVQASEVLKIFNQLRANSKNPILFHQRLARMDRRLEKLSRDSQLNIGEIVLTLFFLQILKEDYWIIDFRAQSFLKTQVLLWRPRPYFYKMSAEFISGTRQLYTGFYLKDDHQFEQGLEILGMKKLRPEILAHFGDSDQSNLSFHLKAFEQTFSEIFKKCSQEKLSIHSEFFLLGATLLGLYENLESMGGKFDVRASFLRALALSDT